MLAVTDPALDLFILQLLLQAAFVDAPRDLLIPFLLLAGPVLCILLPRDARPEDNVLAHARGVEGGARRVTFLQPEFGPFPPLRDVRVYFVGVGGDTDAAGRFHFFAGVVEGVGDDCLGAVFVRGDGLWRQGGGVVEFFIIGPVRAAGEVNRGSL